MSCPSAIYTYNANYTAAEGAIVPFGIIVRRYGKSCKLDGGAVNLVGHGYYDVDVSASFTPTGAGDVTIQLLQDGSPVPGALVTFTGTADSTMPASFACTVRNIGLASTISLSVSAAGEFANLAVRVEKD